MAKKDRTVYFCQNCGYESAKWVGKCPSCSEWNTFVEEVISGTQGSPKGDWKSAETGSKRKSGVKPQRIGEIDYKEEDRLQTDDQELDRVLGGGITPGSVVLIGGEPGIGKSTLMLQIALQLPQISVLYVSGEESATQLKMRADRLPWSSENCFVLTETNTQAIFKQATQLQPLATLTGGVLP